MNGISTVIPGESGYDIHYKQCRAGDRLMLRLGHSGPRVEADESGSTPSHPSAAVGTDPPPR